MAPVIVDKARYRAGHRQTCGDLSEELAALRAEGSDHDFLWVGLKDPEAAEFTEVNEELGLHPLAIEDAVRGRQRVKMELYDDVLVVVLKPLRYIEATSDIETGELMLIVGDRFLLTIRRGEASPLAGIRRALEVHPDRLAKGPMAALHAILDQVVDQYVHIDDEIAADLEQIEAEMFAFDQDVDSATIYRLKREVLEFRRATVPLAAPLQMLHSSPRTPVADPDLRLFFRDVADHLAAVLDHVDTYDRLLTDILSAHLAKVGVRQNEDMRRISAWVAMAAVPTMIAGIYGMNFDFMPELTASVTFHGHEFEYGYFVIVGFMGAFSAWLYRLFRRSGWL